MPDATLCRWDAEARAFRPLTNRPLDFEDGGQYRLEVIEDRNWARHRAYFAQIRDYWDNLPESAALEPWAQSPEHLRKYALIRCGYSTCATYACGTAAEARRTARVIAAEVDEFTVIVTRGSTVEVYRAKSQAGRAMTRAEFNESADRVQDFLAGLVGQTQGAAA